MKRIISACIAALFLMAGASSFLGCGSHPIIDPRHGEGMPASLPEISSERVAAEEAAADALRQYLDARLNMEKIGQLYAQGSEAEADTLQKNRAAWLETQRLARQAEEMAGLLEANPPKGDELLSVLLPGSSVAYASMPLDAEEEEALRQQGEAFAQAYAEWPAKEKFLCLAGQMREDAASAIDLLDSLMDEAEISEPSAPDQLAQIAAHCKECRLAVLSREAGKYAVEGQGGEEAFAHFWDGNSILVEIAETESSILIGKNDKVVFLVGRAKILRKSPSE